MGEPVAFQEQEATSSTVTVVETDEQVCKYTYLSTYYHNINMYRAYSILNVNCKSFHLTWTRFVHVHTNQLENFPLNGIRILDMTRIVAGPFCTMILGDLGAEVLKIERPGTGDDSRKFGPPFIKNTTETCYFISLNRNKKSVCVDFKCEKGRDLIYKMAKISDVLIENYVPGKLSEYGLGYEDLVKIAPHLIYCSITGYGSEGCYKNKPGYDITASSVGGLLYITGPEDGEPVRVGVAVTDMATGLYAHGAIMAALIKRSRTGKGEKIDCDLLSTQVAGLINIGSNYLNNGIDGKKWGTALESLVPYQAFPVKDGFFTIGVGSDSHFKVFCCKIGHDELANYEKFSTNQKRVENRLELIKILENIMKTKTKKEWSDIFEGCSFPFAPVNTLKETFSDPHIKEIGIVQKLKHPLCGDIKVVGPPVKFSDSNNAIRTPSPLLGEHTDEILTNLLGYSKDEILDLKKFNVVM